MTQDSNAVSSAASLAALMGASDPAAQAAQRKAASEAAQAETMAAIREKGFSAYVEDLEKEKIEKIREKLLKALGLTEEGLEEMDPATRDTLESLISQEIQKRLAGASLMNAAGKDGHERTVQAALMTLQGGGGAFTGSTLPLGTSAVTGNPAEILPDGGGPLGQALLLTLQEVENKSGTAITDGKSSRDRGRGLPG